MRTEMTRPTIFTFAVCVAAALAAPPVRSQIYTLTKEQMIEYTAQNPFERFPDGRPKVPDSIIERAKGLSAEEVWNVLPGKNFRNQYEDGFQVLHPGKKMVGRAFTVQFMPARPDVESVMNAKAREKGAPRGLNNQFAIDMLQPGDVLIVDLFGKKEGGTIVGDNLFYYVMKATKGGGLIVDGSIRDLEGISEMDMPAYFRECAPERDRQRDADRDQRAGADRKRDGDAGRPGDGRPGRNLLHPSAVRAGGGGQGGHGARAR